MFAPIRILIPALVLAALAGCGRTPTTVDPPGIRILATHPHDPKAYTQGLLHDGTNLLESTGLYRESTVREVESATGRILRKLRLPDHVFGEGLARHGDRLYVLTWREQTAYEIDPVSFTVMRSFTYPGEGWGLTSDGRRLIMSDGTSSLRFINPADFAEIGRIQVTGRDGRPLMNLNELEYVDDLVYANVYMEDRIVAIDPDNGSVRFELDLSGLRAHLPTPNRAEVLNGIAFDPVTGHFFITGKRWPVMFEVTW